MPTKPIHPEQVSTEDYVFEGLAAGSPTPLVALLKIDTGIRPGTVIWQRALLSIDDEPLRAQVYFMARRVGGEIEARLTPEELADWTSLKKRIEQRILGEILKANPQLGSGERVE